MKKQNATFLLIQKTDNKTRNSLAMKTGKLASRFQSQNQKK